MADSHDEGMPPATGLGDATLSEPSGFRSGISDEVAVTDELTVGLTVCSLETSVSVTAAGVEP